MLNENLRTLRKAKGLSQEELSSRLNVVRQTISKWEKGLSVPDAELLLRIAEELDTSVNTLLGETIVPEKTPDAVAILAKELETLNEKLAQQAEIRRRRWRASFAVIAILSILSLTHEVIDLIYGWQANRLLTSNSAVIGGADAPTSIRISLTSNQSCSLLLSITAIIISFWGIIRTRHK